MSQNDNEYLIQSILENKMEARSETDEPFIDVEDVSNELAQILQRPLNINKASEEALNKLIFLSKNQILNLLAHREKFGDINDMEEFQIIKGYDLETIKLLKHFIHFGQFDAANNQNLLDKKIKNQMIFRTKRALETAKGYEGKSTSAYLGDPYLLWFRYKIEFRKSISAGILLEKDPGERLLRDSKNWNGYHSGYIAIKNYGWIKTLVIGDYQCQFGQGLTFQTTNSYGKSSEVLLIEKHGVGIKTHTSSNEFNFLRGFATTINLKGVEISPFVSFRFLDANLVSVDGVSYITSIRTSGYYRTNNELNQKQNTHSQTYGFNIFKKIHGFKLGLTAVYNKMNIPFDSKSDIENIHDRSGKYLSNVGFHFSKSIKTSSFFGEISKTINRGQAIVVGMNAMPINKLAVALVYRNYGHEYLPISSGSFGEKSLNKNEKGIYTGFKYFLNHHINLSFYMDRFLFPWVSKSSAHKVNGTEYLASFQFKKRKKMSFNVRYKFKEKPHLTAVDQALKSQSKSFNQSVRFQIVFMLNDNLRLRNRITFSLFKINEESNGFMAFQELKYKKPGSKWSCLIRYTSFDIADYNSRIYAYEQDLNGVYSIPSFSGKGTAYFIVLQFKPFKHSSFGIKYAKKKYDDRKSIGSGLDETIGSTKSEVKLQWQLKF